MVVQKTATEHAEQVPNTVRRTNVDIDRDTATDTDRSASGYDNKDR